jgi:signal transduction histidine kinase
MVGLQLMAKQMQGGKASMSDTKELLEDIITPCSVAVTILDDLLLFDKIESGKMEVEKSELAISTLVASCFDAFVLPVRDEK